MMLYEEVTKGLCGPERISIRWPARCHVHVAELKETALILPKYPPYQYCVLRVHRGDIRAFTSCRALHLFL